VVVQISTTQLTLVEGSRVQSYDIWYTGDLAVANVCINITSNETRPLSIIPSLPCFTQDGEKATISVSVPRDFEDTNRIEYYTLTHGFVGQDYGEETVDLTVYNIDRVGVRMSSAFGYVHQFKTNASYGIQLESKPTSAVRVDITSVSNLINIEPSFLDFDLVSWNNVQSIIVSSTDSWTDGSDILTAEITHSVSSTDVSYAGAPFVPSNSYLVHWYPAPKPKIVPSISTTSLYEMADPLEYTVRLDEPPRASVDVSVACQGFCGPYMFIEPALLEFTNENWNLEQTVSIRYGHDMESYRELNMFNVSHIATGLSTSLVIGTLYDIDTAAIVLSRSTAFFKAANSPSTYEMVLTSKPKADVSITLTYDPTLIGVTPFNLEFNEINWNVSQTLSIQGLDNGGDEIAASQLVSIVHSSTSIDENYNTAMFQPQTNVVVRWFSSLKPRLSLSSSTLSIREGGDDVTYTITLDSEPPGKFELHVDVVDAYVTANPTVFFFTPGNWSTARVVTLSYEHNSIYSGASFYSSIITHSVVPAANTEYFDNLEFEPANAVKLTSYDIDMPAILLSRTSAFITEGGSNATYSIRLSTQPSSSVDIRIDNSNDAVISVSPSHISFDSSTWNASVVITIIALPSDGNGDDIKSAMIALSHTTQSGDSSFDGYNAQFIPSNSFLVRRFESEALAPCSAGTYASGINCVECLSGSYSLQGAAECIPCPAGYGCPLKDQVPRSTDECPLGTYSTGGESECNECPAGYMCPFIDEASVTPCSNGYYASAGKSVCSACPKGFECLTNIGPIGECSPGFYSGLGESYCRDCPMGSFCDTNFGLPQLCPLSTYSSTTRATQCNACPAGYFCGRNGTVDPEVCPEARYSAEGSSTCAVCAPGYWCSEGSTISAPEADKCPIGGYCLPPSTPFQWCPAGTIGTVSGGYSAQQACESCPEGFYCLPGGINATKQPCDPGYYCPMQTMHATQYPCGGGTYNPLQMKKSANDCQDVPQGNFAESGSSAFATCPKGHYCPEKTAYYTSFPCPSGTYNPSTGLDSSAQCLPCSPGAYCPTGSIAPILCHEGTYNPDIGMGLISNCRDCESGWACPFKGMNHYMNVTCSPGYYCPSGTADPKTFPCNAGTLTDSYHAIRQDDCDPCPASYACYSGTGGIDGLQPVPCYAGHYCPASTKYPTQFDCPRGTYTAATNLISSAECTTCPGGFYCSGGQSRVGSTSDSEGLCDVGHYCPPGTRSPRQYPCPSKTYNPFHNLSDVDECLPCEKGNYCETASEYPTQCPAGSYSENYGEDRPDCETCPAGFECAIETINPVPCIQGFYSDSGYESCLQCSRGHYCPVNATTLDLMQNSYKTPPGLYTDLAMNHVPDSEYNSCPTAHYVSTFLCRSGEANIRIVSRSCSVSIAMSTRDLQSSDRNRRREQLHCMRCGVLLHWGIVPSIW